MTVDRQVVRVTGVVQGVGYRPFVHALATDLGLTGHVGNDDAGVFLDVQGPPAQIATFLDLLRREAPPLAAVEEVTTRAAPPEPGRTGFAIVPSRRSDDAPTLIPPDTSVCPDCLTEMRDPTNRRHRYPFIACTHCGPRYTIVTGLPYDRPFTTMAAFPLCPPCAREYDDPGDRRFHAQPTACPDCGPHAWLSMDGVTVAERDASIAAALAILEDGGIVAVKGVGGYHLACDARSGAAVARLRERKQRSAKPFAVMARDLATATALVDLEESAPDLLTARSGPIVLAPGLDRDLSARVAPGQSRLGVLLPYAPLHHLLMSPHPARPDGWVPEVLVMTSGNLSDEPISIDPAEAELRLAGIADAFVHHDRGIHVSCDDSVLAVDGQPVRRSRGFAPLPVRLPLTAPPLVAVGGELKTTVCLASGERAWMSQHIGDTANLETLDLLARTVATLGSLVRVRPEVVVADRHPGYLSRRWAEAHAGELGADLVLVQHHHAHLASLLAEHGIPPDEPVLGITFDGTGYGDDGTIWGGELLLGSYRAVDRIGHLAPVALPGGDAAIRRPVRAALAHLHAAGLPWDDALPPVQAADATELRVVGRMLQTGAGCTPTTSVGRLFDAVSSLVGTCHDATYEGQAAIELEALAEAADTATLARVDLREVDGRLILDPAPMIAAAVRDLLAGREPARIARGFHAALADAVADAADWTRERHGVRMVGLTGGVFANRLLAGLCRERLRARGAVVLEHRVVPPNDGGLALGQSAVAAALAGSPTRGG